MGEECTTSTRRGDFPGTRWQGLAHGDAWILPCPSEPEPASCPLPGPESGCVARARPATDRGWRFCSFMELDSIRFWFFRCVHGFSEYQDQCRDRGTLHARRRLQAHPTLAMAPPARAQSEEK